MMGDDGGGCAGRQCRRRLDAYGWVWGWRRGDGVDSGGSGGGSRVVNGGGKGRVRPEWDECYEDYGCVAPANRVLAGIKLLVC